MRKRDKILIVILALGCIVTGSIVSFSKGKTEEKIEKNAKEINYNYGVNVKKYITEEPEQENVISKKNIEFLADSMIQAGDERSREKIIEALAEREQRKQANYLKAIEEGFVVTDEEIEKAIEETKEEIKGTSAEMEIEAFCEGAGITIDEYWNRQKDVYRKNYLIQKYMRKCQEDFSESSKEEEGFSGDFAEEFERISEENIEEFGVVVE